MTDINQFNNSGRDYYADGGWKDDQLATGAGRQKSATGSSGIPVDWPSNWWQQGRSIPQTGSGSVVEACVSAYAQTFAQLPGRQYQLDEDGTKTYVTGSKLARVLAKPNSFQTRSDFGLNMVYSLLLTGNAYFFGMGRGAEKPDEIYLLDPRTTMAHRVRETGDIFYSTSGEFFEMSEAELEGRTMIPSRYIGHVRLHTPRDPLIGVTPLTNAAASVAANEHIVGSQAAFFANMARPSGVLQTDLDMTKEQMAQMRQAWEDQSKSLNSGGVPILSNGLKWSPLSIDSQDAQLVEAWKMTVEDISRVFRVPPMLINNMENASFDNAETLMRFWLSSGLGFLINHIELAMSAFYRLDDRKEGVEYDQEVLLRADLQGQMEALGVGVTKGLLAPNEGRKKIGYGPVEGGDMPLVQTQMIPVNIAADPNRTDVGVSVAPEPPVEDEEDEKTITISAPELAFIARGAEVRGIQDAA